MRDVRATQRRRLSVLGVVQNVVLTGRAASNAPTLYCASCCLCRSYITPLCDWALARGAVITLRSHHAGTTQNPLASLPRVWKYGWLRHHAAVELGNIRACLCIVHGMCAKRLRKHTGRPCVTCYGPSATVTSVWKAQSRCQRVGSLRILT